MKRFSIGIALLGSTLVPGVGWATFDCTSSTDVYSAGITLSQDYVSYSGSVPCIKLRLGGILNVNGHTISCSGTCSGQAIYVEPSLTSTATVKNAVVDGAWAIGVQSIDAYQKPVVIQANRFTNLQSTATAISGGTQIKENVIISSSTDTFSAIIWSPVPTSITAFTNQYVEDNFLDLAGGYAIREQPNNLFGTPTGQPNIDHNFISGADTYIYDEPDRITGNPSRADVFYNVIVNPPTSNDPFPNASTGDLIADSTRPNTCDGALVSIGAAGNNPDLCVQADRPYALP